MAADPVRAALVARLLATPAVTGLLGAANGVFHRRAPRGAVPPYLVLHRQAGTDNWSFAGQPLERELWTVKAIGRGSSSAPADELAKQVTLALNDAPITVAGYAVLNLRRESKLDYAETDGENQYHHVGGIFRVDIAPL